MKTIYIEERKYNLKFIFYIECHFCIGFNGGLPSTLWNKHIQLTSDAFKINFIFILMWKMIDSILAADAEIYELKYFIVIWFSEKYGINRLIYQRKFLDFRLTKFHFLRVCVCVGACSGMLWLQSEKINENIYIKYQLL